MPDSRVELVVKDVAPDTDGDCGESVESGAGALPAGERLIQRRMKCGQPVNVDGDCEQGSRPGIPSRVLQCEFIERSEADEGSGAEHDGGVREAAHEAVPREPPPMISRSPGSM